MSIVSRSNCSQELVSAKPMMQFISDASKNKDLPLFVTISSHGDTDEISGSRSGTEKNREHS